MASDFPQQISNHVRNGPKTCLNVSSYQKNHSYPTESVHFYANSTFLHASPLPLLNTSTATSVAASCRPGVPLKSLFCSWLLNDCPGQAEHSRPKTYLSEKKWSRWQRLERVWVSTYEFSSRMEAVFSPGYVTKKKEGGRLQSSFTKFGLLQSLLRSQKSSLSQP